MYLSIHCIKKFRLGLLGVVFWFRSLIVVLCLPRVVGLVVVVVVLGLGMEVVEGLVTVLVVFGVVVVGF